MVFKCAVDYRDELEVFKDPDEGSTSIIVAVNPQGINEHVYLSREDARALAQHILNTLEEK